jgi:hypothetical protein
MSFITFAYLEKLVLVLVKLKKKSLGTKGKEKGKTNRLVW